MRVPACPRRRSGAPRQQQSRWSLLRPALDHNARCGSHSLLICRFMDRGDASNRGRDVRYLRFTESQAQVWTPGTFGLLEVPGCSGCKPCKFNFEIADINQADHAMHSSVERAMSTYAVVMLSSDGIPKVGFVRVVMKSKLITPGRHNLKVDAEHPSWTYRKAKNSSLQVVMIPSLVNYLERVREGVKCWKRILCSNGHRTGPQRPRRPSI